MKRRKTNHKKSMVLIIGVVLVLVLVIGSHSHTLLERRDALIQQEEDLLFQIEQEERRALKIEEMEEFVGTDEYIRQVAEETLGLIDPDGIIFMPVD